MSKDEYLLLEEHYILADACPVCGATPQLWQYIDEGGDAKKVVSCPTTADNFDDPKLDYITLGCPLYSAPMPLYCATVRRATDMWNSYVRALVALRSKRAPV